VCQSERSMIGKGRNTLRNRLITISCGGHNEFQDSVVSNPNVSLPQQFSQTALKKDKQGRPAFHAVTHSADLSDKTIASMRELQSELVKAKVALAECETKKDEQIQAYRERYVFLREKMKTYASLVCDLEIQLTDTKMKLRSNGRHPKKAFLSIKSFVQGGNKAPQKNINNPTSPNINN